jgi:hypothetical protein
MRQNVPHEVHKPEDLTPVVCIDADCHNHCHRDDPLILAHLHEGRVSPEIRPLARKAVAQFMV